MKKLIPNLVASLCLIAMCGAGAVQVEAQFITADTYTRYELLAPETHQFKIYYEVTETRVGARFHFNQIREGSEASDESVVDLATDRPLKFEVRRWSASQNRFARREFSAQPRITSRCIWHIPSRPAASIVWQSSDLQRRQELLHRRRADHFQAAAGIPRDSVVLPAGYENRFVLGGSASADGS